MEKTLLLMRHAKSGWGDPSRDDFDRPLNQRGQQAMGIIGPQIAVRMGAPALILCSSARRTRETLGHILPHLEDDLKIHLEKHLYLASSTELLGAIRQTGEDISSLLVIAHNPGIQDLAFQLSGQRGGHDGGAQARKMEPNLPANFPTAALALFFIPAHISWQKLGHEKIDLAAFLSPKQLARQSFQPV